MKSEIIYNKNALDIVLSPFLIGRELEIKAVLASQEFFSQVDVEEPIELAILQGGKYYHISEAYERVTGNRAVYTELDCKRRYVGGEWKAFLTHIHLDHLNDGKTLVIGDTIATGVTLQYVLEEILKHAKSINAPLEKVVVFTIAGSDACEQRLENIDKEIPVEIYYSNAKFALADNGTELLFEGAEYHPKSKKEIDKKLGWFAQKMKCAIWDWGDRFRYPQEHLHRIWDYYSEVNAPAQLLTEIKKRKKL